MKKLFICLVLILLCACSNVSQSIDEIETLLNNVDTIETKRSNNSLTYYSFYLPSDMGQEDSDDSLILSFLDSKIVMSLNVKEIINKKYYQDNYMKNTGAFDSNYLYFSKEGVYKTLSGEKKDYVYNLYKIDDIYAIDLETSDVSFLAYSKTNIKDLTRHLFIIAKSVDVDTDTVISDYSNKSVVNYQKKQIDLFDSMKPTNGNLQDLLVDDATVGDNVTESPSQDPSETNDGQ